MPRAIDLLTPKADHDPLANLLDFSNIDQTVQIAGMNIKNYLDQLLDTVVEVIKDATGLDLSELAGVLEGLDLSSPEAFLQSLVDAIIALPEVAMDLITQLIGMLVEAPAELEPLLTGLINLLVTLPDTLAGLLSALVELLVEAPDVLMQLLSSLISLLVGTPELLAELAAQVVSVLATLPDSLSALLTSLMTVLFSLPDMLTQLAEALVSTGTALLGPDSPLNAANLFGAISGALIPALDASKITTGVLDLLRIPTLPTGQISGLPAALASMLTTSSPFNAANLFGQLPTGVVGLLPVSHIGVSNPNLITAGGFDTPASVASTGWVWDGTDGQSSPLGCASTTANSSPLTLVAPNTIAVTAGQTLSVGAFTKYAGLVATAGQNAIRVNVAAYLGSSVVSTTQVVGIASPSGTSPGWIQLIGSYTVPAGVDNILVQLQVTGAASAGTVKYDNASASKTGLMSGTWMTGISGTVASDMQSFTDQIFRASNGGASTGNPLGSIFTSLTNLPGGNIVSSLLPAVIPALDATKITTGLLGLARFPSLPASQIGSGVFGAGLIPSLDASKITTGLLQLAQIPTNLLGVGNIPDLGSLTDQITNALIGTGSQYAGASLPQARGSLDSLYSNVVDAVNGLQTMRSTDTATNISGVNVSVNFGNYPNGPLPSTFTTTYSGTGSSTIGVKGGNAGWATLVNDGNRTANVVYNLMPSNTDFQIVRGTMASPPSGPGSGAMIYAMGRVDNPANPQNYVWARAYCVGFLQYAADVGYTVAGVETIMAGGIPLTWSLDISVVIGVNGNPRRYQAYSGNTLIFDQVEAGTNSKLGAGFRYWGCRTSMKTVSGSAVDPGSVASTSVSDNQQPAVLGSTFRASRRVTSTVTAVAGNATRLPANFYETTDWCSPDMSWDGTNLTLNTEGTYIVVIRCAVTAGGGGAGLNAALFQNPTVGGTNVAAIIGAGMSYPGGAPNGLGGVATFYALAGDVLNPGYQVSGSSCTIAGESAGIASYFEVALLNRSMA